MRYLIITILSIGTITLLNLTTNSLYAEEKNDKESIIIEVEGDPHKHKEYLETYHPFVEVIAVYDKLLKGLALQAPPERLTKMDTLDFVKAIHPVREYSIDVTEKDFKKAAEQPNIVLPSTVNNTTYTGKGVRVGVIDTGIDYNHPDLQINYMGGYDLVDLDEDPMETLASEGMPTIHGTHVAGIVAGNGMFQGVAPEAEIYSYRALGPGGVGTSIQIIAAMEQAIEDGIEVINLSLGNTVNVPDYPTSIAVNRATEHGIAVVIANGNNGPDRWTVGAPATASNALSVGATAPPQELPFLYDALADKSIQMMPMMGSVPWSLEKDYRVVDVEQSSTSVRGKIALVKRGEVPFYDLAKNAEQQGAVAVLIYNNEEGQFQGSIAGGEDPIRIPVASVSDQDGKWLKNYAEQSFSYIETEYEKIEDGIAPFSSRGPVTVNWDIKPDVLAPGTNIISTVPGGYQALQGTSMAAPHVTGAIALLKEAHPNWSNEQIFGALRTTALRMEDEEGIVFDPIIQGAGSIDPKKAIATSTIIHDSALPFGKVGGFVHSKTIEVTIENTTDQPQTYSFDIPNKQKGVSWKLPQSFTVEGNDKKTIPIELRMTSSQLEEGVHQGWLSLNEQDHTYYLPYLFINETADYPKAAGFDFHVKPFSDEEYFYQIYLTEDTESVQVDLYQPDTLLYDRTLLQLKDVEVGMNEGYLKKSELGDPGSYKALITIQLDSGEYESYEVELYIDP
ncbi:S8 family serine peptidase [Ornithinibacillus sp. L9]|uniref:S8 family serine peptidase n=1 Tax=Ornithinibacillus caprae TaxID=2678566 RepID=A0A6N8FKD6_9BACI|nr:S8 family serine peptidase [Ornithinibacillus caprae]MUK89651.1 S8 family serine peptidase [Ornithinibacillus caprae]